MRRILAWLILGPIIASAAVMLVVMAPIVMFFLWLLRERPLEYPAVAAIMLLTMAEPLRAERTRCL